MGLFDIFKINHFKQQIKDLNLEISKLKEDLNTLKLTKEDLQYIDLKEKIESMQIELKELENKKSSFNTETNQLIKKISELKTEISLLESDIDLNDYGFYTPKYDFENSAAYKLKLDTIKLRQKDMVKNKMATIHNLDWTIDGNRKQGKEFILDTIKLLIRAFNNECDNIICKVKFSNVETSEKRINKVFEDLNKLTDMQRVSIKQEYLNLKLEELYLKYEFECKKQEEKEEQAAIKERMREEAKALKEIENALKKVEKEEKHFNNAISEIKEKISNSQEGENQKLLDKLKELEEKLAEVEKAKIDISEREKNTRAGYVYVISNIGSFGEDIYKIGMTRRLEPMDRVKELGNASVPFKFDVHAMIFSEDAPTLENALHKKFKDYSVNKVNLRKEFFKVSLEEIEKEVNLNHNAVIEFTKIAEASDYRQSLAMSK